MGSELDRIEQLEHLLRLRTFQAQPEYVTQARAKFNITKRRAQEAFDETIARAQNTFNDAVNKHEIAKGDGPGSIVKVREALNNARTELSQAKNRGSIRKMQNLSSMLLDLFEVTQLPSGEFVATCTGISPDQTGEGNTAQAAKLDLLGKLIA